jgi:DNA-binding LytR/AlgR family response regulator
MRDPTDPARERTADPVHASPVAVSLRQVLTICLVSGAFLGLIGPLGTHDLNLALRLGYWTVALVGGGLLGWAATQVVVRWRPVRERPWLTILTISALMTPPGSVLVWLWVETALGQDVQLRDAPTLIWQVFLISLAMTALNRLILPHAEINRAPVAASLTSARSSPFLERLPPRLRGATVYAVQAEDHYLRIHTSRGSDLILLRLADALKELSALEGAQTHRSWWAARDALETVRRHDGRATLILKGGLEVPVSRAHAAALRASGWL